MSPRQSKMIINRGWTFNLEPAGYASREKYLFSEVVAKNAGSPTAGETEKMNIVGRLQLVKNDGRELHVPFRCPHHFLGCAA